MVGLAGSTFLVGLAIGYALAERKTVPEGPPEPEPTLEGCRHGDLVKFGSVVYCRDCGQPVEV